MHHTRPQACQQIILTNVKQYTGNRAFEATAYPQMLTAGIAQQKVELLLGQLSKMQQRLQARADGGAANIDDVAGDNTAAPMEH